MSSFAEEIAGLAAELGKKLPQEALQAVGGGLKTLKESGIEDRVLKPGQQVADFELLNAQGDIVTLAGLLEKGPVVIVFYRGAWCPFCNLHLGAFQRRLSEFKAAGASLVAISPQTPETAGDSSETIKSLEFEVLSDSEGAVASQFGVLFDVGEQIKGAYTSIGLDLSKTNPPELAWKLPIPATFVLDRSGSIVYSHVDVVYAHRSDPAVVLEEVQKLQ